MEGHEGWEGGADGKDGRPEENARKSDGMVMERPEGFAKTGRETGRNSCFLGAPVAPHTQNQHHCGR